MTWSGPPKYTHAILCATGESPIDVALGSSEPQRGKCEVLLGTSHSRSDEGACSLSPNKIFSIFHADMDRLHRYFAIPETLEFRKVILRGGAANSRSPDSAGIGSD